MKRNFNGKQLSAVKESVGKIVEQMRQVHATFQGKVKELDARKKDFTPEFLRKQQQELRDAALKSLRYFQAELHSFTEPVLAERALHDRAFYFQDAGFSAADPNFKDQQANELARMMRDTSQAMRQFLHLVRLQRLSDEQVEETAALAAQTKDVGLLGLCLEESGIRKNGLLKIRVEKLVNAIAIPEADVAADVFDAIDKAHKESVSRERLIIDPSDQSAHAVIRSQEISRETAEQEAHAQAERAEQEKEAAEASTRAEKEMASKFLGKDLATAA